MKKIIFLFQILALVTKSATVTFTMTNSIGQPDTNAILLQPLQAYANADGSWNTAGLPFKIFPNTNGYVATNLAYGNWLATNATLCGSLYSGPGLTSTSQGIIIAIPIPGKI